MADGAKKNATRIIVKNLSYDTTEDELSGEFKQLGEITECILATDAAGRSKGFGFISFASADSVTKAMAEDAHFNLGGRDLRIQIANARTNDERKKKEKEVKATGKKLYCGDLPWELSADELCSHFEKYGKVENAYLAEVQYAASVNGYKPHKGFGFVEYSSEDEATAALREQQKLKGIVIRVTSAKGEPVEKKKRERKRSPRRGNSNDNSNNNNNSSVKNDNNQKINKPKDQDKTREKPKEAREGKAPEKANKKPTSSVIAGLTAKKPQKAIRVKPAPSVSPWSKKSNEEGASVDSEQFPSLADVAAGKVKPKKKRDGEEVDADVAPAEEKGKEEKEK